MVKCSVVGCNSKNTERIPGISFHRFPKKIEERARWLNAIKRPVFKPSKESRICSKHFHQKDINYTLGRVRLKDNACPFLSIPDLPPVHKARLPLQELDFNLYPETNNNYISHSRKQDIALPSKNQPEIPTARLATKAEINYDDVPQARIQDIGIPSTSQSGKPKVRVVTAASVKDVIIFKDKSLGICTKADSEQNLIKKLRTQNLLLRRKLKVLSQKTRRQKRKIISLNSLYDHLIKKEMITHDNLNILNECSGPKELLERQIFKHRGKAVPKTYGPELRTFALTLNFLSPKAYDYVRTTYNTALPHPRTLCKWYESVDAEPGFSKESLVTLKKFTENCSHPIFCSLIIDEMSIRKSLEWDNVKKIYRGRVTTGNTIDSDSLECATEALVFLVTAINGSWKLPVAYFLIHSLNGQQRANLVKMCLVQLKECNVHVVSLTFDGAASNIGMAENLGCNFRKISDLVTKFDYEGFSVNVFFDPCHMIKLVRNAFGELTQFVNEAGEIIDFKYVQLLLEIQENEGLHLGTKLRKAHVNFFRQKMKVRLATQLMSSSVADALKFCRDTLKLSKFKNCGPTADFIKLINDIFDILNSRSKIPPGWKKALFDENIEITRGFFLSAAHYIKHLALTNGNLVCTSKRKTGFVGLIVCMVSAINLYDDLVEKAGLHFLPLYKISQDHIELFFSSIRSRGGWNNNPTSTQFKGAYRRLLVRAQIREGGVGNCIPLQEISILNMSSRQNPLATINSTTIEIETDPKMSGDDVLDFNVDALVLSEYSSYVVEYIAGFIVKQLAKAIKCEQCLGLILDSNKDSALTKTKDKGGLTYASYEIKNLIKRCEKILKEKGFQTSYLSICSSFFDNFDINNIFKDEDRFHESEHKIVLIKSIIYKYLDIRYKHEGKRVSQSLSDRSFYTKLILFKNQ